MMRMVKSLAALAAMAVLGTLAAPPGQARAEEMSLKAGFYSTSQKSQFRLAFNAFVDHVNETGEGRLGIDTVVDTAAIPRDQMPQALKDGIVDIIAVPPSVLDKLVPGMGALSAARVGTAEMRANGTFDLVNEYLAGAANARLVGLYAGDLPFHVFTSKPVRSLEDFKGLRLRGTNTNREAFTALGAQPLQVGRSEIYTSMQRGVIDGYANINNELWASSWVEVAKYRVDPGFFAPNIAIFVNLDRWNAMTPEQQEILSAAGVFVEGAPTQAMVAAEQADAERAVKEAGFEIIALPEADAQKFLDLVYGAQWDAIVANAPDLAAKLRPKIAE